MLRVALRPRFLGLLALMIAATIVCGLLATWQWDRAHRAMTARTEVSETVNDLTAVLEPGSPVTNELVGTTARVEGVFAPEEQIVIPGRQIDGQSAAIIVTALHVTRADGSIARLPVARGWLPESVAIRADGTLDPSAIPAPPEGTVQVSGRLEASESATSGVSGGIAQQIATPLLVNTWGGPMYYGYIAVQDAPAPLQGMPAAQSAFSAGLDWQNLGYALQWIVFGGFFLYLWWRSVRTVVLDERAAAREALAERAAAAGVPAAVVGPSADAEPTAGSAPPVNPVPHEREETGADSAPAR